ncbi:hypothetical protein [Priestia aryabhattai]
MKYRIILIMLIAVATTFCLFGADIAGFLTGHKYNLNGLYYLTVISYSGILFYLVTFLLAIFFLKKKVLKNNELILYCLAALGLGIPIGMWTIFVVALSWG